MPIFKPFRGIRPHSDILDIFPTRSINNFTEEELVKKAVKDSYVKMIKPFILSKSQNLTRNYRTIRNNFEEALNNHKLVQDEYCYYLYQQTTPDNVTYRGFLGLACIDEYNNGKIKRHEATIKEKKEKLTKYLEKVNFQAEPVLLTYRTSPKLELIMNQEINNVPVIKFVEDNGFQHKVWRIDNRLKMQQIKEALEQVDTFYIADGHHRIGSVALNAEKIAEKNKKTSIGNDPHNFVYSYIVSKESIRINDYNRLVKHINNLSTEEFLKRLEKNFTIHEKGDVPYFPSQKFHMSIYIDGKFYSLHVKHDLRKQHLENDLDHFFVEKYIFNDILGIELESTSDMIDYLKGTSDIEGILNLKEKVDSGEYNLAIAVHPITFNDLVKISENEIKMPPKCTLIEPKLMTALIMYDMK